MGYAYPVDSILTYIAGEPQYDRAVSSETLRSLYAAMMTNGILLRDSTNLQVVENEGLKLKVKSGFCLMNGCMKKFDNDTSIELAAAETTRVDTIVARLNLNQEVRDITIEVIQGTGTEPPALVRAGDIYDLGLANVTVNAGAVTIAPADINDTRLDTERCGIISSISEFDTKTLYDQMNDSFYKWFETIQGQIGEDAAGSLQMQVNILREDVDGLDSIASERLLWNISDKTYKESTQLNIPSLSNTLHDILFYDGKLYALTSTSGSVILSVYQDNTWSTVFTKSLNNTNNGCLIEYKGNLYIGIGGEISGTYLWKLNGTSTTNIKNVNISNSRCRVALCKDVENDILYFGWANFNGNGYITYITYDGVSVSTEKTTYGGSSSTMYLYDFYVTDNKLYINYMSKGNTFYYLAVWDLITDRALSTKYINHNMSTPSKKIGNSMYGVYSGNILYKLEGIKQIEKIEDVRAMCGYDDSFLIYSPSGEFSSVKLYKIATSYATKGTKIYLIDNSFAISDNLEPIDNGYLVTADGEVKIAIYE